MTCKLWYAIKPDQPKTLLSLLGDRYYPLHSFIYCFFPVSSGGSESLPKICILVGLRYILSQQFKRCTLLSSISVLLQSEMLILILLASAIESKKKKEVNKKEKKIKKRNLVALDRNHHD